MIYTEPSPNTAPRVARLHAGISSCRHSISCCDSLVRDKRVISGIEMEKSLMNYGRKDKEKRLQGKRQTDKCYAEYSG